MPRETLLQNRIKGVKIALKGALLLLRTEASIQIQFGIAILVTGAGFVFHISATEWMLQFLCIGLIMGIESINTAIEKLADFVHPEQHQKIGDIKDVSAGAVMIASLMATAVGLIIYVPKILGATTF